MTGAETINDIESFKNWLYARPWPSRRNDAADLASRSALRALPLANRCNVLDDNWFNRFILQVFWRNIFARTATYLPNGVTNNFAKSWDGKFWSSLLQAEKEGPNLAAFCALHAAVSASLIPISSSDLQMADFASISVIPAFYGLVAEIGHDAVEIESAKNIRWQSNRPLWTSFAAWPKNDWTELKSKLLSEPLKKDSWSVWIDWYESIVVGEPVFGLRNIDASNVIECQIAIGGKDGNFHFEFWDRPPGEINREIAEWVAKARAAERVVESQPTELTGEARLAGYRFVDDGETIKGQYNGGAAFEAETARQLLHELLQKLKNTAERLTRAQVDPALPKVIQAIADYLDKQSASMNAGLVLSQFRTWETNLASVSAALRGQPLDNDLPGILASTQQTFEDLKAMFPSIATIEANRLALRLQAADAQTVDQSIVAISVVAGANIAVDQSARDALKDLQVEVSKLNEIIASSSDHDAVAVAIETRGVIVGQRAMTTAGFVHTVLKAAGNRIAKGAGDGLEKGVAEVTEAGVKLALIGLVGKLGGPLASVAALLAMFKPYAKKAEEIKKETTKDDDVTDV